MKIKFLVALLALLLLSDCQANDLFNSIGYAVSGRHLFEEITNIYGKVYMFDSSFKELTRIISTLPQLLTNIDGLENKVQTFNVSTMKLQSFFDNSIKCRHIVFNKFLHKEQCKCQYQDNQLVCPFYNDSLQENLLSLIPQLRNMFFESKDNLIDIIHQNIKILLDNCSTETSHQYFFFNLVKFLIAQEFKSYVTLRNCLILGNAPIKRINEEQNNAAENLDKILQKFSTILPTASREIERCATKKTIKNETYTDFTGLYQRYLAPIKDLRTNWTLGCPDGSENDTKNDTDCGNNCKFKQRKCLDPIRCKPISNFDLCVSDNQNDYKRYSYFKNLTQTNILSSETEITDNKNVESTPNIINPAGSLPASGISTSSNNVVIDNSNKCNQLLHFGVAVDEPSLPGFEDNVCSCVCDGPGDNNTDADYRISLGDVVADVNVNFVVTGVRFVKKHHAIFLEIEQGKLLQYGGIDKNSLQWKLTKLEFTNNDTLNNGLPSNLHVLDFDEYRRIALSKSLDGLKSYVVTGVRLQRSFDTYIHLEAQLTPFDFNSGRLFSKKSIWRGTAEVPARKEIREKIWEIETMYLLQQNNLIEAPTDVELDHRQQWMEKSYIPLQPTSLSSKDAGSTVVPYIDIQPVKLNEPAALADIGLGYLGAKSSGGYLNLRISTYDVTLDFNTEYYYVKL